MTHPEDLWEAFSRAVVRIDLPEGSKILRPAGSSKRSASPNDAFPFDAPVHIVTAYNPNGIIADDEENRTAHARLTQAVSTMRCYSTVGSAEDGSFAEPGVAIADIDLSTALDLGREFGQAAIYCWTSDALTIVGINQRVEHESAWTLADFPDR